MSTEHHHQWVCGWDSYVCDDCDSERSFSTVGMSAVVVVTDTEERVVRAVLEALRAVEDTPCPAG